VGALASTASAPQGGCTQALRGNIATFELPKQKLPECAPFGSFVAAAPWATRGAPHPAPQATPGQLLVLGRGTPLGTQPKAD